MPKAFVSLHMYNAAKSVKKEYTVTEQKKTIKSFPCFERETDHPRTPPTSTTFQYPFSFLSFFKSCDKRLGKQKPQTPSSFSPFPYSKIQELKKTKRSVSASRKSLEYSIYPMWLACLVYSTVQYSTLHYITKIQKRVKKKAISSVIIRFLQCEKGFFLS